MDARIIISILNGRVTADNFDFNSLTVDQRNKLIDTILVAKLTLLGCGLYSSEYETRLEEFSLAHINYLCKGS